MKPNNMAAISSLMSGALQRHGIAKQVNSAMVVDRAKNWLTDRLDPELLADLTVVSFAADVLTIDCRHPASVRLAQSLSSALELDLTQRFPSLTIKQIFCRLRSTSFKEPEHW
jgi:hypothetical protein